MTRDLAKIKVDFTLCNDSWRDTRVKVPNDTYCVESVQEELKRYEEKFSRVQKIVSSAEKVLNTEPTTVVDERVALTEWQKVKVKFSLFGSFMSFSMLSSMSCSTSCCIPCLMCLHDNFPIF